MNRLNEILQWTNTAHNVLKQCNQIHYYMMSNTNNTHKCVQWMYYIVLAVLCSIFDSTIDKHSTTIVIVHSIVINCKHKKLLNYFVPLHSFQLLVFQYHLHLGDWKMWKLSKIRLSLIQLLTTYMQHPLKYLSQEVTSVLVVSTKHLSVYAIYFSVKEKN